MGIDVPAARFLGFAAAIGVDFDTTLTLGRQSAFGRRRDLVEELERFDAVADPFAVVHAMDAEPGMADPLFRALGARVVDAMDASRFEGAEVVQDLNLPVPESLRGRWSCVVDGGTTEHVFDLPQALESAMRMVAPGGHLLCMVPADQQLGHGFYQVSPELYFRALGAGSGFRIRAVFLHETGVLPRWFRCEDPTEAGHRLEAGTFGPATVYVAAQRVGDVTMGRSLSQSDYAAAWETGGTPRTASQRRPVRVSVAAKIGPGATLRAAHLRRLWVALRGRQMLRVDLVHEAARLTATRRS